jgi:hemerythrin-like domain-containing protein
MKSRRQFLLAGAVLGVAGVAAGAEKPEEAEEVSAVEDLMREHGVLRRILLVYEECLRRVPVGDGAVPGDGPLKKAALLVQKFVEDYHEKLEEDFLFPEFEKRNELVPLVRVLKEQHVAGRALTAAILDAKATLGEGGDAGIKVATFIRMYRPHAAREDTVLFPALHKILSEKQLDQLGDKFEAEENRRFGKEGFEKVVEQVAAIEKQLGIYDLAHFTPKAK